MYDCLLFGFLSPKGSHVMENYSLTKLAILSICLYTFKKSVGDWGEEGVEKSLEGAWPDFFYYSPYKIYFKW